MRIVLIVAALSFGALGAGILTPANAQSFRVGPGGVEVNTAPPPPPRREEGARDELRERMFRLREACEEGDRRACVRLGIIIGENRGRREAWRRDHPELFFWDR